MAGRRIVGLPRVNSFALWSGIALLLVLGMATTLVDFSGLAQQESKRAQEARQRFVIHAVTGEIMLSSDPNAVDAPAFDVAKPETPPTNAEPPAPATTTEPPPADTTPAAAEAPEEAPPAAATSQSAAAEPEPVLTGAPTLRTTPMRAEITAPAHSKDSLVPAPAPEVSETVNGLTLPKRGGSNMAPSKLYARPFTRAEGKATLTFVIMDVGLDAQSLGYIMPLPPEITVAYSPYSRKASNYSEHLRAAGHEVWTMLPAMNDRYPLDDPGPMGIISAMPAEETLRRTQEVLAVIDGSVGLVTAPNEAITNSAETIAPVLGELSKRGLLMLSTHPSRTLSQMTTTPGLIELLYRADLVLDPTPNEAQIRSKLAGVIAATKEKGSYVVVLSARPQSLQLLAEWLKANPLPEAVALAPLSAVFSAQAAPEEKPEEVTDESHAAPKKEKPKPKPPEKKKKPLPQDKYLAPAGAEGGGHGGAAKPEGGGH
jgi:uncharacterized protein